MPPNPSKPRMMPQGYPTYSPVAPPSGPEANRYGTQSLIMGVIFLVAKGLAFLIAFLMGMHWAGEMADSGRSAEEIARIIAERMQSEGFFLYIFEWFGNIVGFIGFLYGLIGVTVKNARKGPAIAGLVIGSLALILVIGMMLVGCLRGCGG